MITPLSQIFTLRSLLLHPHLSRDEIVAFQNKQLRRLIDHAYKNVPYYRRLFNQNGLKPQDIRTTEDLPAIPITSKKDIQALPIEEVVACNVNLKQLVLHTTSGSSGEPSIIRRTRMEDRLLNVFRQRAMHYWGLRITDRRARLAAVRPIQRELDNQLFSRILKALGMYRQIRIDCRLSIEEILSRLRHCHPDVLTGYAGVISRLAQNIGDNDRLIIRPRFLMVTAEVCTPLMRQQITEAFNAPVYNIYGSYEFNVIAWECMEIGELHTCDDGMIIEVLKKGFHAASGEQGEVIGTNLHSFAMPFIRYRLGDVVTKGSETCHCGKPFSTIKEVQGRMMDYFLFPDGRLMHPYEISMKILPDETSWLRQYQLTQESEDRVILRVVPFKTPPSQKMALIEKSAKEILGQNVEFKVILTSELELLPSGKFRAERSLVQSNYD